MDPWALPFLLSYGLVLTITAIVLALRRRVPGLPAAWVAYVVVLLPVLGIVQSGPQIAADRYTYLAGLGGAILAGAGLLSCWRTSRTSKTGTPTTLPIAGVATCLVVGLGALTWNQAQVWHDSEKLWTHALAMDPQSSIAENNLGVVRADQSKLAEAIEHYQRALQMRPDYADAHTNLGDALFQQGKLAEASDHYRQALAIKRDHARAHNNWGIVLARQGKLAEASDHFQAALHISPDNAEAHNNWGIVLVRQGKLAEASDHYQRALRIMPDYADAHYNWGNVLAQQGKLAEASDHFRQALRLKPDHTAARSGLVQAQRGLGPGNEHPAHSRQGEKTE
jgi:Tfp pilus assembly protein PilF